MPYPGLLPQFSSLGGLLKCPCHIRIQPQSSFAQEGKGTSIAGVYLAQSRHLLIEGYVVDRGETALPDWWNEPFECKV